MRCLRSWPGRRKRRGEPVIEATKFYIDGRWQESNGGAPRPVIDPGTGEAFASVTIGTADDADRAVAAARRAFASFSRSAVSERIEMLEAINAALIARNDEIAAVISAEMGAPEGLSRRAQATSGTQHFAEIIRVLREYEFETAMGSTLVRREPVGVCALITPWNWPMNQLATKVAPALAAGCTMVLKPSELAPLDAVILAEIIHEAGVPAGVFNLVHGDGPGVGARLAAHPDIDMISFTGSTRAGIAIGEVAARSIKRVSLELGGKSANIILDDADFGVAVPESVRAVMLNSGQSCNAPTRMMVPRGRYDEACAIAAATAQGLTVGAQGSGADLGPVANGTQYERVVGMIETGVREGAVLLAGGSERPAHLDRGYFVSPTIFGGVSPGMSIVREEIFGPVLVIMSFEDDEDAIRLANDTEYGLSGYVWSEDRARALSVASALRTGMVHLNGASLDTAAPFGGYGKSGNGREWGVFGLEEFLEIKSIYGGAIRRSH
ncbi:MAG: aldehyde dehydrogenase family protein [Sphingopyxis sp.]|nr:aldehyde dehydrogenase family protein [Sphingopyxis sp.]